MKRLLKEPLVHFLVLGALLFGAYAWLDRGTQSEAKARQVRIGEGEVAWLTATWTRQWRRAPTREELRGLVTDLLKEELFAREARELRLDENDTIVRRRLAQKLEFLVQDTSRLVEPTEDELRRYYAAHPDQFQIDPRVSFRHVFFSRERRKDAAADATAALADLSGSAAHAPELGDRLMLEPEFRDVDVETVATLFGRKFATAIVALAPGSWRGPIESGYGVHLVRVADLKRAEQREFTDVRTQVIERWRDQRRREDNERYFAGLLKKYDVVLDDGVKHLVGLSDGRLSVASAGIGARE